MSVIVQVSELVAPLGDDSQRVFEESDYDEEATDCGKVSAVVTSAVILTRLILALPLYAAKASSKPGNGATHGFTGSLSVSSQSSILLVCSRIASSGLGSLVFPSFLPAFPNGLWLPRWYPAVPRICAIIDRKTKGKERVGI
jgi:hypothetical protein